jgi:hypothetical protein
MADNDRTFMIGQDGESASGKSVGTLINELAGLVIAYVKQQTLEPLKSIGRYVAFGVAGAVLIAAGGVLLILTVIRLVQTEAGVHLHGNLTWVPYVAGILVAGAGAGLAAARIAKGPAPKMTTPPFRPRKEGP